MLSATITTTSACLPLVEARPSWGDRTIFVTVSPNPMLKHSVVIGSNRKRKIAYGKLPQALQYEYCMKIVKLYTFHCSEESMIVGTWELNKTGNVHIHMLIDDPMIINESRLHIFRREIALSHMVEKNLSNNNVDYMNNIVFIDKPIQEIAKYMDKDYDMNRSIYPNYCSLTLHLLAQDEK